MRIILNRIVCQKALSAGKSDRAFEAFGLAAVLSYKRVGAKEWDKQHGH